MSRTRFLTPILLLFLTTSYAVAGERAMCIFVVDLSETPGDAVYDSLIDSLLSDGCWADSCNDESRLYAIRRDLPSGVTSSLLQSVIRGRKKALDSLRALALNISSGDHGYFWHPDGFLIYERTKSGRTVRLTAITMETDLRVRTPAVRTVSQQLQNNTISGKATSKLLRQALAPLWDRFVP
jgi:hypothetical protein